MLQMTDTAFADILLIEHNPAEAETTKNAILQCKLTSKIHCVKDAEEAIHFIFGLGKYTDRNVAMRPRMIILDVGNSRESGIEFLKVIKEIPSTKNIAVFILSSTEQNDYFADAVNAGVNICMVKEGTQEEFAPKLKRELGYYWRLFEEN